ncbi:unnamed protein product, partial [Timema podura]|nr:unnamed protein product [Timema podura]
MVWTVIQSQEQGSKSGMSQQDLGLAHWGRVLLHRSSTIRIQDTLALDSIHRNNLQCYDLRMDVQDTEHLYVATNTGQVVHCLKTGGKPSPRTYIPNCDGFTSAKCIETCPFDEPFFLVSATVWEYL